MNNKKTFVVYKDGKEYFVGNRVEVSDKININPLYITKVVEEGLAFLGQYTIKVLETDATKAKKKEEEKYNNTLEYLRWHLEYMGITNIKENPKRYIGALKEMGFEDLTYYQYKDIYGSDYIVKWGGYYER